MNQPKNQPKKFNIFFSKIENREEALKVINDSAWCFLIVAGMQAAIGIFYAPMALINALVLAGLAIFFRRAKTRLSAILLLLSAILMVVATGLHKMGIAHGSGANFVAAWVLLMLAMRAFKATSLLHGRFAQS